MANLVGIIFYYQLKCHSCGIKVETRSVQYEKCPSCGSISVTSARAERMEGIEFEAKSQQAQRDANQQIERELRRRPSPHD